MKNKKRGKTVKKEIVHHKAQIAGDKKRLPRDKAEGIMAVMSAVLVILSAMLNPMISVIISIVLMVLFAAYKLLKR